MQVMNWVDAGNLAATDEETYLGPLYDRTVAYFRTYNTSSLYATAPGNFWGTLQTITGAQLTVRTSCTHPCAMHVTSYRVHMVLLPADECLAGGIQQQ
jgi:hypothetical protein